MGHSQENNTNAGILNRYQKTISISLKQHMRNENSEVYKLLSYSMGWIDINGNKKNNNLGKALRPSLCLFACESLSGSIGPSIPAAVAIELIHKFSLIHDDIQDKDEFRYNQATLWTIWGVPKALIAGNVLRIIADQCLEKLVANGTEIDRALFVIEILTQSYLEMIEGQYLDIYYEGSPGISIEEYMNMIKNKTGALIKSSLQIGAVIGTQNIDIINAFSECGSSIGYLFQIRDDILGVWGESKNTGKPVGSDIKMKKNSFPICYAISNAKNKTKKFLIDKYSKKSITDNDVIEILDVLESLKIKKHAEDITDYHAERAIKALKQKNIPCSTIKEIENLVDFLSTRNH